MEHDSNATCLMLPLGWLNISWRNPLGKDVLKMDSLVEEWRRNAGVRPLSPTGLGAQPPSLMSEKAFLG